MMIHSLISILEELPQNADLSIVTPDDKILEIDAVSVYCQYVKNDEGIFKTRINAYTHTRTAEMSDELYVIRILHKK
jgi:hypothetical protein